MRTSLVRLPDQIYSFVRLEKSIVIRAALMESKGDYFKLFSTVIRNAFIIMAHAWFFYMISFPLPAGMPSFQFNLVGFTFWPLFTEAFWRAIPLGFGWPIYANANKKWVHLFVALATWEALKVLTAFSILLAYFWLFPNRPLAGTVTLPDVAMLAACSVLCVLMGTGLGLIFSTLKERWPIIDPVEHILFWILFSTSGIYEPYSVVPTTLQWLFKLNPMTSIIECARKAVYQTYPVDGLSLLYPLIMACGLFAAGLSLHRSELRRTPS